MRVIIFTVIALTLGVVGGVAARLPALQADRAERAAADSAAAADSVKRAAAAEQESTTPTVEPYGTTGAATAPSTAQFAADTQSAPQTQGSGQPVSAVQQDQGTPVEAQSDYAQSDDPQAGDTPPSAEPAPPTPTYSEEGARKLAEIFAAMDAKAAAAVLEGLTAEETRLILTQIDSAIAAQILSEMSPELAAMLSRVVLVAQAGGR